MNATTHAELGQVSAREIRARLGRRRAEQDYLRGKLKEHVLRSGRMTAIEARDWLCCISECLGDDIREFKEQITEVTCNLEDVHYGDRING